MVGLVGVLAGLVLCFICDLICIVYFGFGIWVFGFLIALPWDLGFLGLIRLSFRVPWDFGLIWEFGVLVLS